MFKCTVCDEILEPHQCIFGTDEKHCEVYVCCPCCGGECGSYDGEEDEGNADEEDEWGDEGEGEENEVDGRGDEERKKRMRETGGVMRGGGRGRGRQVR